MIGKLTSLDALGGKLQHCKKKYRNHIWQSEENQMMGGITLTYDVGSKHSYCFQFIVPTEATTVAVMSG